MYIIITIFSCFLFFAYSNCTIFFGFQRCLLGFAGEDQYKSLVNIALVERNNIAVQKSDSNNNLIESSRDNNTSGIVSSNSISSMTSSSGDGMGSSSLLDAPLSGEEAVYQYMILTRDKAKTYPIITGLPKAANAQRVAYHPIRLRNVKIDNSDFQLVETVMKYTASQGGDHDIVHYQMAFQVKLTTG